MVLAALDTQDRSHRSRSTSYTAYRRQQSRRPHSARGDRATATRAVAAAAADGERKTMMFPDRNTQPAVSTRRRPRNPSGMFYLII
jgi:hypothetical protein